MRHPYSTNSDEHKMVPFYLAILSVFASLGLAAFVRRICWTPPLWLDVSSVMFLYASSTDSSNESHGSGDGCDDSVSSQHRY